VWIEAVAQPIADELGVRVRFESAGPLSDYRIIRWFYHPTQWAGIATAEKTQQQ